MIPFLNHDEANRALMASRTCRNKQHLVLFQKLLLLLQEWKSDALRDTGRLVIAEEEGVVTHADGNKIAS
jgi:DNA-directed RNA polymerase beta subunit